MSRLLIYVLVLTQYAIISYAGSGNCGENCKQSCNDMKNNDTTHINVTVNTTQKNSTLCENIKCCDCEWVYYDESICTVDIFEIPSCAIKDDYDSKGTCEEIPEQIDSITTTYQLDHRSTAADVSYAAITLIVFLIIVFVIYKRICISVKDDEYDLLTADTMTDSIPVYTSGGCCFTRGLD
jgi:hypothetical protein